MDSAMIKRLLTIFILCIIPCWLNAGSVALTIGGGTPAAGTCAGSTCTGFLTCQNLEGSGFDNSESWLTEDGDTGAADPDYTTSPLRGSQSLHMKDDDSEGTYSVLIFTTLPGINALYGFFRVKILDLPSGTYELMQTYYVDPADMDPLEPHEMIWIGSDGKLHIWFVHPEDEGTGSHVLQVGTVHYVWFYIIRSADGKSSGWIKVSESLTIPESNDIAWANVTHGDTYRGTNAIGFTTMHSVGYEYLIDQVLVKTTEIGTVCE